MKTHEIAQEIATERERLTMNQEFIKKLGLSSESQEQHRRTRS